MTLLSGWLFADLLLGLAMLFLVASPGAPAVPTPTPTPTLTPTSTPTPRPTSTLTPTLTPTPTSTPTEVIPPTPVPTRPGVELAPREATLVTNADVLLGPDGPAKDAERLQLRQQIWSQYQSLSNRRAGFVISFGNHPNYIKGNQLSEEVAKLLQETVPTLFKDAPIERLHYITDSSRPKVGEVYLRVYLLGE